MKKIFITLLSAAAFVACSKSEVQYEANQTIGFAPIAYNQTKAALAKDAVPTCNLIVSANAGAKGATAASNCSEEYFKNVVFTQGTTQDSEGKSIGNGIFTAEGYFWPNVKYLTFSGITYSAGVDIAKVNMDVDANSIIIEDYPQQQVGTEDNDLMWFEHTTPTGKTNNAVAVAMKHACSWIVLNFIGDETSGNTTRPWRITNITINSLTNKETATLTSSANWSNTGSNNNNLVVYNNGSKTTGGQPLDAESVFTPSSNGIIVIPQKPTTLTITYNYVSQFGPNDEVETDDVVIEEVATVELNFDGTAETPTTWSNWAPGTKYTYDVTIGAAAIKIAPKAADWVVYDADSDTGENQNIVK